MNINIHTNSLSSLLSLSCRSLETFPVNINTTSSTA